MKNVMKTRKIGSCLVLAGVLAGAPLATASEPAVTLASCAELLPPGQSLEFKIEGTITTTVSKPDVESTISLSDGEDRVGPPPWQEELWQFLACVKPWVAGSDGQN